MGKEAGEACRDGAPPRATTDAAWTKEVQAQDELPAWFTRNPRRKGVGEYVSVGKKGERRGSLWKPSASRDMANTDRRARR